MAEPTILSWTPANWITVVLMVGVAFVIVAATAKVVKQRNANATS
jgi:urea transporter